jgi:hypothetical protein
MMPGPDCRVCGITLGAPAGTPPWRENPTGTELLKNFGVHLSLSPPLRFEIFIMCILRE